MMVSANQGGIKSPFLSLWYDSTWDWTPVSQTIYEHFTHLVKSIIEIKIVVCFDKTKINSFKLYKWTSPQLIDEVRSIE